MYNTLPNVKYHKDLIDIDSLDINAPKLIIIDDIMEMLSTKKGELISQIFTKHGHHRNISVILVTQNVFVKGSHMRNCQLNNHYQVLFTCVRTQVNCLAKHMYPTGESGTMLSAFSDATSIPYGYLLVDLNQRTEITI